ncbi:MAG: ATP-binding protein [Planctomycetota bacterium]|nr:ATP-binding protein [Planctomycetota bacterium]
MNELVVISGKGGTGKTSLVASLAVLADDTVLADCDVDAADLHLVMAPEVKRRETFVSGHEAVIRQADCTGCGTCLARCRFDAVLRTETEAGPRFRIDPTACEGCGVCVRFCPEEAIDFPECECGEWFISESRHGPMVHARLAIGAENSGKLVTLVRQHARQVAEARGFDRILVDGPPGIGCPVIAAITGASFVVVATEPTLSGRHDFERVVGVARHFGIPAAVCVNKWDLNPKLADAIEDQARSLGLDVLGRVRYDEAVTEAQVRGRAVVEVDHSPAADEIRIWWEQVCQLNQPSK